MQNSDSKSVDFSIFTLLKSYHQSSTKCLSSSHLKQQKTRNEMSSISFIHQAIPFHLSSAIHQLDPPPNLGRRRLARASVFAARAQVKRTSRADGSLFQLSGSTRGHTNKDMVMVSEFMTKKEDLHVLRPSTPVDEALKALVEKGLSGFPVIDDHWDLVGIVSDYDLLALALQLDGKTSINLFPDVDSSWKTFHAIQKLLCKTNGTVVGDIMTSDPLTVQDTTSLEDATRMMLETKFVRLPVVDAKGTLVGIITREDVVRAARRIKAICKKLP